MTALPSLDIVICTYNNASMLHKVLDAIAMQQVSDSIDWCVLVVNNNCTDETDLVVQMHQQRNRIPKLLMVKETQQGLTPARLRGAKETSGAWIAFVDDDCVLAPDWVASAVRFMVSNPDSGAFGGRVILCWQSLPPPFIKSFHYSFAEQEHGYESKTVNCLVGAGIVINRSALLESGWIERQFLADRIGKKLVSGGDVELALRLGALRPLRYTPSCQLKHLIPAYRMSPLYLMRINFELGTAKLFGDSMLWPGSYVHWLRFSLWEAVRQSFNVFKKEVKAILGPATAIEVAIYRSFWLGWWVGIWRMLRMDAWDRQALLGCAVSKRDPS